MKNLLLALIALAALGTEQAFAHGGTHPTPALPPPNTNPIPPSGPTPPPPPPTNPLPAPAFIVVPASSPNGCFVVYWGAVSGITGFELEETYNAQAYPGFPSNLYPLSPLVTAVQLNGRANGNWFYRVRAVSNGSYSDWRYSLNHCTVFLKGTLTIRPGAASPPSARSLPGGPQTVVMQVEMKADQVESIAVNSLTFSASGSLDDTVDIVSVELAADVNGNGSFDQGLDVLLAGTAAFPADNGKVTLSAGGRLIQPGSSESYIVMVRLAPSAPLYGTFALEISYTADVSATGSVSGSPSIVTGAPVRSGLLSVTHPAAPAPAPSGLGSLKVSVPMSCPAKGEIVAGSSRREVLHLLLEAGPSEPVRVETLVLSHFGTVREPCGLVSYSLWEDSNFDGMLDTGRDRLARGPVPVMPESDVILFPSLGLTVPAGGAMLLILAVDVAPDVKPGSTLGLNFESADKMVSTGCNSQASLSVEYSAVLGPEMTVTEPAPTPAAASGGCAGGPGDARSARGAACLMLMFASALAAARMARKSSRASIR